MIETDQTSQIELKKTTITTKQRKVRVLGFWPQEITGVQTQQDIKPTPQSAMLSEMAG